MNDNPNLYAVDMAALGGTLATLAGWLPNVAAALSIIWLLIRIVESPTFQSLWKRVFKK